MLYTGIDLGTSSVKLVLYENGKIIKTVSRSYPLVSPCDGYYEQPPDEWLKCTLDGLYELYAECDKDSISGIGIAGQMHGLVVLGGDDVPLRNAVLWNDGRSGKQSDYLNTVIGKDVLIKNTGNISFPGFTAPKILWMRENERELFTKIRKIMLPKDYLVYMLTGEFTSDPSDASGTLLYDVKNRCWSNEICAVCGVDIKMLPTVHESFEAVGCLKKEYAEKLGIKQVKVASGAGDNAAAALGVGCVENGDCNISLGTSGTLFVCSDTYKDGGSLHSFAHANGKYHLMGCMLSAASCAGWWSDILQIKDMNYMSSFGGVCSENNVFFAPYLTGERCPYNNPSIRGAFIGLSATTTRDEMSLAVLEGVAFGIADMFNEVISSGVNITHSFVCGGGAANELWLKIIASVLNIRLSVSNSAGPAAGGAILASVACGEYKTVSEAVRAMSRPEKEIEPVSDLIRYYKERYAIYKKLYPSLCGINNNQGDLK